ncbi:MAG: DUF362 domain-containing protein [Actinobacteria bacterium]|nr:DUF362 domain-containing protein [Actinomycetota bacterium]
MENNRENKNIIKDKVAIQKCGNYNKEELSQKIEKCVSLIGGFEKYISGAKKILLKPNLLSPSAPATAVTTHPVFVESIIDVIKRIAGSNIEITIADSPGVATPHTKKDLSKLYGITGFKRFLGMPGITLNLDTGYNTVPFKNGKVLKQLDVIKPVLEADLIINLPKFKTHSLTRMTGAVKNMYGIIHGKTKTLLHTKFMDIHKFNDMLLDIYLFKKPVLNIMDGILGMESEGPGTSGKARQIGLILAGTNGVALDNVVSIIMGFKEKQIPLISCARERNLPGFELKNIEILGEKIEEVIIKNFILPKNSNIVRITKNRFINTYIFPFIRNTLSLSPYQNKIKCDLCGTCRDICPETAIIIEGKKLKLDYKKCVRCFCCSEMCPNAAMDLKYSFLGNLIFGRKKNI